VDITWPSLDEVNPAALIQAIKTAADTQTVPPDIIVRWLLTAMGEKDIDEIIDRLTDDAGNFLWPAGPGNTAPDNPADLARAGGDPASVGVGSMTSDGGLATDDSADGVQESLTVPNVLIDLAEARGDDKLRAYWVHGAGAAQIRWGEPHDFDRCVRHLGKYVTDPQGLCNVYHRAALGVAPGQE
jgi:hypothetical protein